MVIVNHPDIFWGVVASFFIGNVLLVVLNVPLIGLWVRLLQVPYQYLYPVIIVLICIGVYSVNNRSEEHTSELQSLMRISYAVFCLKKNIQNIRWMLHIGNTLRQLTYQT